MPLGIMAQQDLRGALSHLAAVGDVHDDARPEIQTLYGVVLAGNLLVAVLEACAADTWVSRDALFNASMHLEGALRLAHRQASRTIILDPDQMLTEGDPDRAGPGGGRPRPRRRTCLLRDGPGLRRHRHPHRRR
ncbi:hypothetical protein ABZ799_26620 [Nocardiopsis dassonvillei]|uniref:hypothetical protein n=1 Tax=Nocardiopsis dassonvillei TaxID=2014 RepID=UPI0033D50559